MPIHEELRRDEAALPPGEQIRRLIERMAFQANRTAKSPGPDAVHDLRVALRRAEQALVIFKLQLPRRVVKQIRKQLKAVLSSAGAVRDYDIAVKTLLKFSQPGAAELRHDIRLRRKAAERSLLTRLSRLSLRTRISRWITDLKLNALEAESGAEVRMEAGGAVPKLARRFFEAGESAAAHNSGEKLHEFRIRAKKLRYTLELFIPVYGRTAEGWIAEIKSVQSILGAMNDYRSVLTLATRFGCSKELKASLKRSERRKIRQFRDIWTERFSPTVASEWKRVLQAGGTGRRLVRKPVASATAPSQAGVAAGV